jgi:hypothetical protein
MESKKKYIFGGSYGSIMYERSKMSLEVFLKSLYMGFTCAILAESFYYTNNCGEKKCVCYFGYG